MAEYQGSCQGMGEALKMIVLVELILKYQKGFLTNLCEYGLY